MSRKYKLCDIDLILMAQVINSRQLGAPYTFKLNLLLDRINLNKTNLYLIDIDNKICDEFIRENNLIEKCEIGGWGEIYWIKNYNVVCCLGKDFDEVKLNKCYTLAGVNF